MPDLSEFERLEVLRGLNVLDTPPDARLDAVTILAKMYFNVPIALVSLVDDCRQWFKSRQGLAVSETDRDLAFCHHAIKQIEPMVIPDARLDKRFATNALVTGEPFIRFYAGAPIIVDNVALGTVCLIDEKPRSLDDGDLQKLSALADMVASFLKSYRDDDADEYLNKDPNIWERDKALDQASVANHSNVDSTAFLELILNTIPDVVFVKDAEFRHIRGNPAFFELFPEEMREQIIGMTGTEEFKPEEVALYQAKDREAFENGYSSAVEQITVLKDEPRTFDTRKVRFADQEGDKYILGLARDITEKLEAERAVEQATEFRDLMFEHIPDMVFVKDEQFRIIQANEKFLNVYPENIRETVIGTTTLENYEESERKAFLVEDERAFDEGFSEVEESIQFPDGERRVLLTRKIRFENHQKDRFILGIGRDITELADVREKHEQSLELLNNVINTVTGAVIGLNVDRDIITINDAGRHMLAGNNTSTPFPWPDEVVFLDPADMKPLESSHDPIARALIGHVIGGEVHLMTRRSSSEHRYVRVTTALVQSKASPLHTVIVLDDVSEAERNRQHIERQSRLDALGQLTGGIAHDFNNLLNTMQYALELIRREDLSERGQRSANAALKSITRGAELTNRLLAFAKKQPSRSTTRSLREILFEIEELVSPTIEASLTVEFSSVADDLFAFCDQSLLQNALLNLVLNSRDAIVREKTGHLIKVEVRAVDNLPVESTEDAKFENIYSAQGRVSPRANDTEPAEGTAQRYIEISVSDNGPGMSGAIVSRAVDPFFTTKDVNSGTGLGLSMVYGFVQQSDGEMRIYTEEGKGTTVRLFIPRGDRFEGVESPVAIEPTVEGNGETIFVVEDEEFLLEQLVELLKELKYKTVQASSGRAAIDMVRAGVRADLILTDVVMPGGIGGFEFARLAREIIPDIPIIYTSGYTGFTNEEMGDVIAPLLPKPSSPTATSKQIRHVLDRFKNRRKE